MWNNRINSCGCEQPDTPGIWWVLIASRHCSGRDVRGLLWSDNSRCLYDCRVDRVLLWIDKTTSLEKPFNYGFTTFWEKRTDMLAKQLKAFVVHFFLPEQLRQLCHILFLRPGNDSIYPYDIISYIRTYPAVLNPNALLLAASFL